MSVDKFIWDIILEHDELKIVGVSCSRCSRLEKSDTCLAFPDGIPEPILTGEHDHTTPYPGDNGVQFEPVEQTKRIP